MKNILVPTDFSKHAEYALEVAAQLAKKFNAQLHLLHVVELPVHAATDVINMAPTPSSLPEALFYIKLAQQQFEKFKNKPYLKDLIVSEIVETNNVFRGITEATKKTNADLIVMGSEGASGFKEMFVGSNTEKVVRHSSIPVLVIKKQHSNFKLNNIVLATNLEETAVPCLQKAKDLADKLGAYLQLLYVNTANNFLTSSEIETKYDNFVKKAKSSDLPFAVYNDHKVEWGILHYAQKTDADAIAVATHGRKGVAHFFNGSISEDLANHAKRPVITFSI